jgi:predicted transcriptional regulator
MEENQNKTVNMAGKEVKKEETKKISYEDLQKAAGQLYQQNQQLIAKCKQYEEQMQRLNNVEVRLHYLFEVLDKGSYFDNDFIDVCVNEIKEIMTIKEESEEENTEGKEGESKE